MRPTTLETDWSICGMGYWLHQKYCKCEKLALNCCESGWRVAMCGSRFCIDAESRYALIEGELAAVAWALQRTRLFTLVLENLVLVTDH